MRLRLALLAVPLALGVLTAPPTTATSAAPARAAADEAPGRMLLLLDSSGSMAEPAGGGQSKIEAARSALGQVVDDLPAEAEVGLRVFGATVFSRGDAGACTDSQLAVEPGTDNRDALAAAVDDYQPYGETPIPHALEQAAADLGDEGARSIVLVSDGESTCSPDPCQVAADLAGDGIELRIDVVGLSVSGKARRQLQCIAESGNGHYYDADRAADIVSRLIRVAERAARSFSLGGLAIQGGPVERPTPVTVGDWTDVIGAGTETRSFSFTRTEPGTTVRVAAITQGDGTRSDGLKVELVGPDGARCDSGVITRTMDLRDLVGVDAALAADPDEPDGGPCAQPGDFRITVTRSRAAERPAPYGLRITEEPALGGPVPGPTSTAEAAAVEPSVDGPEQATGGGTSFASATPLEAGRWTSAIVPGEALVFRVPLEFGQALRVGVRFPGLSDPVRSRLDDPRLPQAQVTLFNPMQATLRPVGGTIGSEVPDDVTLLAATPPVDRGTLSSSRVVGTVGGSDDVSTAGDHYVMVSVEKADATVELPFVLDVEVEGEPGPAPSYPGGVSWTVADGASGGEDPTAGPDEGASTAGEPGAAADRDDESSSDLPLIAGGVALVVLVAGISVWALLRRRRA